MICLVGNSYLHAMTARKRYILRVELTSWNNSFRYAEYSNFAVGSLNEEFRLTLGAYSGDAGNQIILYQHKLYYYDYAVFDSLFC